MRPGPAVLSRANLNRRVPRARGPSARVPSSACGCGGANWYPGQYPTPAGSLGSINWADCHGESECWQESARRLVEWAARAGSGPTAGLVRGAGGMSRPTGPRAVGESCRSAWPRSLRLCGGCRGRAPSGWRVARRQYRVRPGCGPGLDASRLMRPCGRLAADESNRLTGPRASVRAG